MENSFITKAERRVLIDVLKKAQLQTFDIMILKPMIKRWKDEIQAEARTAEDKGEK